MVLMRPQLRREKEKPLRQTVPFADIRGTRCRKSLDRHARGDDFDLVRRDLAKMGDQIFFDEMTARLKVVGVARTETIGDPPAQAPRPAKEFRVMNLLDVVHA